jgi:tRNA (guanine37-N1)-methyltransferase
MQQEKLEQKVIRIFEEQGFKVEKQAEKLLAEKEDQKIPLKVYSSDKYEFNDIQESVKKGQKIFVDEKLEETKQKLENPVSVIRENKKDRDYDLPSYELIGEIAIINELTVPQKEAIEGILEHHPSTNTILLKEEPLKGEYRVGEYKKLYGEETETIHKEFGCRFKVDPTKVYYSERFSTERKRVVDQIQDGEKVLVMFAGVGPFAIMAAEHAEPEKVVSVEKNPKAAKYLKQNIELNNKSDTIETYEGDVREILPNLEDSFDRIIMPLPESAHSFLNTAIKKSSEAGIIHLYCFKQEDWASVEKKVFDGLETGEDGLSVLNRVVCGDRGPSSQRVCLDIKLD